MLKQPFFLFIFDIKQTVCTKTFFIVSKYMPKKKLNQRLLLYLCPTCYKLIRGNFGSSGISLEMHFSELVPVPLFSVHFVHMLAYFIIAI